MNMFNHRKALLGLAVVAMSLIFALVATQNALADQNQVSDMNDRFASETTGANGWARVRVTQDGGIVVDRVKAKNLLPNHEYQVVVTIQNDPTAPGPAESAFADQWEYSASATTDKHGNFVFDDFVVPNSPGPGKYRMDVFVTHTHPTIDGAVPGGKNITSVINRDPLLACAPTFRVTVE